MNKASRGDGISVELFQILRDDAVKVLHSICQQIWKTQQWPQDWKKKDNAKKKKKIKRRCCESAALNMSANLENSRWPQDWKRLVFIPIPKKGNAKECSNYHTIALISHASKVMFKILQARL